MWRLHSKNSWMITQRYHLARMCLFPSWEVSYYTGTIFWELMSYSTKAVRVTIPLSSLLSFLYTSFLKPRSFVWRHWRVLFIFNFQFDLFDLTTSLQSSAILKDLVPAHTNLVVKTSFSFQAINYLFWKRIGGFLHSILEAVHSVEEFRWESRQIAQRHVRRKD